MSQHVTEIVYIPFKVGLDLESGDAAKLLDEVLSLLAKHKGTTSINWGRQIETPNVVQMVIGWNSVDDHKAFEQIPEFEPFIQNLSKCIAAPLTIILVKLPSIEPGANNPLLAPVTECINAFFPPEQSESEYASSFQRFRDEALEIPDMKATALIGGWSIETHQHENLGEGVDGKLFTAFVGWPSVEAHLNFRKTEAFPKITGHLRAGAKAVKVWHVAFKQYK
ncbi:hypothetical protein BDV96DRAFT_510628 [Lophiotrema nucula]|uniref:ABM domain-containing protein n=1 Tax=Lophiotrema nucula TaxID=690887 RepID=A0A6A5ZXA0_9PLEO|nr:hypothetical protein BDV96DRAFT_510628 [Lophiotrema nucula]